MRAMSGLVLIAALAAGGCVSAPVQSPKPQEEPSTPFDPDALRSAMDVGAGSIEGQVFLRTVGGDVKLGAGSRVTLIALTPYVQECRRILQYANSGCFYNVSQHMRAEVADGEGRFRFQRLKPGTYVLDSAVRWSIPTRYGLQETGGDVSATAVVNDDGSPAQVLLTR